MLRRSTSPPKSTLRELMNQFHTRVHNILGRSSVTASGQKRQIPTNVFTAEFMEFYLSLGNNPMKSFITTTCNVDFDADLTYVYIQTAEHKGKIKSSVNLDNLPYIYMDQLNIPWPNVTHSKKRKAREMSRAAHQPVEIHEEDHVSINELFNTPPVSPQHPTAMPREGLGKMKGRSSRAERKHAHDTLAYLKERVVESRLEEDVNDTIEGPAKLKRLLKKCLQQLDALPTEKELSVKAKEAEAYKWVVKAVKSHINFQKKGLKVKDRDKIILAVSTIKSTCPRGIPSTYCKNDARS